MSLLRFFGKNSLLLKGSHGFAVDAKGLTIGVPKEVFENESRVAISPEGIKRLVKKNEVAFKI